MTASSSAPAFQPLETIAQLLAAAARHGLSLTAEGAALDTLGLDFLVVHARDPDGVRWVVRAPRRADVVAAAATEARILALVRRTLPVAVPDWRVHAAEVIAYPRLDGVPAVTLEDGAPTWNVLDPAAPAPAFLDTMAAALAALQAIPADEVRAAGVPVRSIAEERAELARILDLTRAHLAPPEPVWARWQRWLADDASWPAHAVLCHGDLHPGHMLLDDGARLTGVLDWTEARATDPSVDLALFHMCFGRAALEALVDRLARLGARTWPRLVEHAIERTTVFPALGAEWALRTGNAAVLEQSRAQLAAAEAPP